MRFFVASLVSALTPFSQNSKRCRSSSGLGQAQLWQSNPSFLFTFSQSVSPRPNPVSRAVNFKLSNKACIPAAVRSASRNLGFFVSSGGCAPGVCTSFASSALSCASLVGDPREGNLVGGRSINLALSTRGIHALEQIGIADEVLKHAIPMRGRMIHEKSGGLHFAPYDVDPNKHINSIGRAALNTTVIEAAQRYPSVHVHFNHKCTDVDLDSATAQLLNTSTTPVRLGPQQLSAQADSVIGVDGAFSAVRQSMQ